ncbi:MAG: thioredoxin TrxC [Thiotrichales bacterium]
MTDSKHVVCPHCHAVNRIPDAKLGSNPKCGKCKQPLFTGHPVELTSATFDKHISRSDIPVVVDFWAAWCGPCKMMAPAFAQAATQLEPHYQLAKVDTEAAQDIAARYQIRSIPTVAVFKHGKQIAMQPGAMGVNDIVNWVKSKA